MFKLLKLIIAVVIVAALAGAYLLSSDSAKDKAKNAASELVSSAADSAKARKPWPSRISHIFPLEKTKRNRQECPFGPYFKPLCSTSLRRRGAFWGADLRKPAFSGSCYWQDLEKR